jgi:hypothetical protein
LAGVLAAPGALCPLGCGLAALAAGSLGFRSCGRHEHKRPFHVHGGDDEPEMAGVAGEPAIADAAHAIPALHRGVSALARSAEPLALAHPPRLVGAGIARPGRAFSRTPYRWGVARTEEIIECASVGSSRRTARPPSSVLPDRRAPEERPSFGRALRGATVFAVKRGAMAFARG